MMKNSEKTADFIEELQRSENIIDLLRNRGLHLTKFAGKLTGDAETVGILLVGSVAEGYATDASDIDFLILSYSNRDEVDFSTSLSIESGNSLETLTYLDGVEINTEVVLWDDHVTIAESLAKLSADVALNRHISKMPMIDNYTLRFLHRLRTGIVVYGEDVIEQFRTDFHIDSLPLYISIKKFVLARESLEDAKSADPEVFGLIEFICRDVIEHCCLSLAAANGFTSQSRRFVLNWIADLTEAEQEFPLFVRLRERLIGIVPLPPAEKSALVDEIEGLVQATMSVLQMDHTRRRLLDQIFADISYAQ
ncbi:nucleotidyltransferase domain-containing protein [Paracoccus sulfuroxidans]|uniref:Nucleotidyltransferase-like protein n=1 Tax=Paracoccus sulfuroxidans TaxID=384678 RepID=A0A562NFT7_9RHOB|nr:nucleotidyltransferase domain-containing protein [Paracoccus sulfuroxidans]TWI30964.1 nucleotidyltransferase-like protein [Paracoccus sulfuroxidans]